MSTTQTNKRSLVNELPASSVNPFSADSNKSKDNTKYNAAVLPTKPQGSQQEKVAGDSQIYVPLYDQSHIILAHKDQKQDVMDKALKLVDFLNSGWNMASKEVEALLGALTGTVQLTDNSGVRYINLHGEGNTSRLVVSQPEYASRAFPNAKVTALFFMESSHSKKQDKKNVVYHTANAIASDPSKWHPLALWYNRTTDKFSVKQVDVIPKELKNDQRAKVSKSVIENDKNSSVVQMDSRRQYRICMDFSALNIPDAKLQLTYQPVKLVSN